jgi:integrase
MLKERGMNPATARRYLNVIRAIVTHGIREFGLRGATNPFDRLEVKIDAVAKDERKPFTAAQLKATSDRVANFANADLQRIWRILKGTGARLAEVTGLLVSDVSVDGKHPFLDLVFHPHRRLKNKGSIRRVPLIGDALSATREALSAVGNSPFLFKTYSKGSKGANAASNALMKHVRKITDDRKVVVHSLRHNIEDGFTLASVNEYDGTLC